MAKVSSEQLGAEPIGQLLIKQAVPASIGILVMSLNILVDSIFVGNWIGSIAIAAINVAYGILANLPCILIQRYNRIRMQRILNLAAGKRHV